MGIIAVGLTALFSMCITVMLGIWLIPLLRKFKFGQTILDIGPRWHKDKQGTPTMGGLMFIVGIVLSVVCGSFLLKLSVNKDLFSYSDQSNYMLFAGLIMALAYGLIGFLDDFIKVKHKENEGLTEKQKLVLQTVVAIGYLVVLYRIGERSTIVWVPFIGQWNLGILYYPLALLGIVFMVNAVNISDGIDGLTGSVTLVVAIGFIVLANILKFPHMEILAAALAGGCLGFLVWNAYPAKIFMGDTGSLFLGGLVVALAFGMGMPVILIFMGFIYIVEAVTVMIQTTYFKYTRKKTGEGKRLFKMTPIHHHFEMSGWGERKIVAVFTLIQALFCILAVLAIRRI